VPHLSQRRLQQRQQPQQLTLPCKQAKRVAARRLLPQRAQALLVRCQKQPQQQMATLQVLQQQQMMLQAPILLQSKLQLLLLFLPKMLQQRRR
jgi:hypothetical protein